MGEQPRIDQDVPGFRLATWRNVIVSVWSGPVTLPRLDQLLARERSLKVHHPKGIVPFTVVMSMSTDSMRVGEDVRKRAAELAQEMGPFTIAHPNVVLGAGFWAATVRGVMSATYLFSRAKYPTRAFDSVLDASAWVSPLMARVDATAPGPTELRGAIDEILRGVQSA